MHISLLKEAKKKWVFITHHNGKLISLQWLQIAFHTQHQQRAWGDSQCQMPGPAKHKPAATVPGDLRRERTLLAKEEQQHPTATVLQAAGLEALPGSSKACLQARGRTGKGAGCRTGCSAGRAPPSATGGLVLPASEAQALTICDSRAPAALHTGSRSVNITSTTWPHRTTSTCPAPRAPASSPALSKPKRQHIPPQKCLQQFP